MKIPGGNLVEIKTISFLDVADYKLSLCDAVKDRRQEGVRVCVNTHIIHISYTVCIYIIYVYYIWCVCVCVCLALLDTKRQEQKRASLI